MKKFTKKHHIIFSAIFVLGIGIGIAVSVTYFQKKYAKAPSFPSATYIPYPTSYPKPTPTSTPKPLTFEDMNKLYGPCAFVPTLFYHHVENPDVAQAQGFSSLNVTITNFVNQLNYLQSKGYNPISPDQLIAFFDQGTSLPPHSVMLTFDDGYSDFYVNAYPLLKSHNFKASMFLPTGLMENTRYLTWNQISEMNGSGLIYFGNHTWSHKSVDSGFSATEHEITLADSQLKDHGLNAFKVFVYPYGTTSDYGISILQKLGYTLAFTTAPGSTLCKTQRLALPRVRIGNAPLSAYGF